MKLHPMELGFSINLSKKIYAIGESIFIDVTIASMIPKEILIRQYFLLPADDPRNNIKFEITDNKGQKIKRISHTTTGRSLTQSWQMIKKLEEKQSYTQTFQVAGTYKKKLKRKIFTRPLWSLGESPEININEYPVQQKGEYQIIAIYHNTDDGRNWPEEFWDRKQKVWTGELISNAIEIKVVERRKDSI
jgi:hypothetical protein